MAAVVQLGLDPKRIASVRVREDSMIVHEVSEPRCSSENPLVSANHRYLLTPEGGLMQAIVALGINPPGAVMILAISSDVVLVEGYDYSDLYRVI